MIKFLKQFALGFLILIPVTIIFLNVENYYGWDLDYYRGLFAGIMWSLIWLWDDIKQ